jgi:hypothetical protein
METLTSPPLFLESMGNLALDVRLFVMKLMPVIVILTFIWGYLTFLFGMSKDRLDLKKYLFTPLFLLLLVVFYPTFIDITGGIYGTVIRAFDREENKDFLLKYTGLKEELAGYKNVALAEIEYTPKALKTKKDELESGSARFFKDANAENIVARHKAYEKTLATIDKQTVEAENLRSGTITSALSGIWDFFHLPVVRIIRVIIDLIRNVFISLLVILGCFAIFFEAIPVFKGILSKWFRFYTAVTFWALTVCILDAVFLSFAEAGIASGKYFKENAQKIADIASVSTTYEGSAQSAFNVTNSREITDFAINWLSYGGSEGINTAVCVVLVLCYCMVPYITSLYIGGENAGMFMSKVVGVGSMAVKQTMTTATGGVGSVVRATSGSQSKGEMAKMGANIASISAAFGSGGK